MIASWCKHIALSCFLTAFEHTISLLINIYFTKIYAQHSTQLFYWRQLVESTLCTLCLVPKK